MTNFVKRFVRDESGATAVEYGLIAAGISVAIIAVVQGLGSKLGTTFTSVQNALKQTFGFSTPLDERHWEERGSGHVSGASCI